MLSEGTCKVCESEGWIDALTGMCRECEIKDGKRWGHRNIPVASEDD